jgi:hypothetical protein
VLDHRDTSGEQQCVGGPFTIRHVVDVDSVDAN